MLNRRNFLSSSFASSLAVGAGLAWRGNLWAQLESLPSKLPDRSLFDQNEDAYWRELRQQFLIPADEIYLNNGTVGSSPAPVLRAVFEGYENHREAERGRPEDYPIWGYAAWNEFRDPLGRLRRLQPRRDRAAQKRHRGQ
jgi:isopenicillin-N epimerase